jgi:hypothetical protein
VIALISTTDIVKLSAIQSLLAQAGVECETFDVAAGALWQAIIPLRLMVTEDDAAEARRLLREADFIEAGDSDWDLRESPGRN